MDFIMAALASALSNHGNGIASPSKRRRHRAHAYRDAIPFRLITSCMAQNGDVMTRQVSRQLQRLRWKAQVPARLRRGARCPYERSAA